MKYRLQEEEGDEKLKKNQIFVFYFPFFVFIFFSFLRSRFSDFRDIFQNGPRGRPRSLRSDLISSSLLRRLCFATDFPLKRHCQKLFQLSRFALPIKFVDSVKRAKYLPSVNISFIYRLVFSRIQHLYSVLIAS